jgi:DegV family protein with EDD domain
VDSLSACGGLALIVLAAAAAARAGGDVDAVLQRVHEAFATTRIWFAVDTLDFLRRGGRIGAAQAWLGGALKIKPILTVNGEITPIERVRTSGRAFERMVAYMDELHADGADGGVVQHIQAPDQAQALVARGREIFGRAPEFVCEVGAVIGAHVGPGLLGVGGVPAALLA